MLLTGLFWFVLEEQAAGQRKRVLAGNSGSKLEEEGAG